MNRRSLVRALRLASSRPEPFDPAPSFLWTDGYVRRHLLHAHLADDTDDASRKPETIARSVAWMSAQLTDAPTTELLDLGCGPGLYANLFAQKGFRVTGIDVSATSIAHARRTRARGARVQPKFLRGDLMKFPTKKRFGAITFIYGGFGVLSDEERSRLLSRIRLSLEPGGFFLFDVFTSAYVATRREKHGWYTEHYNGFWSGGLNVVLQESIDYEQGVVLNRYVVIPVIGRAKVFHIWYRPFDANSIRDALERAGFSDVKLFGSLSGDPLDGEGEWIGVVSRS